MKIKTKSAKLQLQPVHFCTLYWIEIISQIDEKK